MTAAGAGPGSPCWSAGLCHGLCRRRGVRRAEGRRHHGRLRDPRRGHVRADVPRPRPGCRAGQGVPGTAASRRQVHHGRSDVRRAAARSRTRCQAASSRSIASMPSAGNGNQKRGPCGHVKGDPGWLCQYIISRRGRCATTCPRRSPGWGRETGRGGPPRPHVRDALNQDTSCPRMRSSSHHPRAVRPSRNLLESQELDNKPK